MEKNRQDSRLVHVLVEDVESILAETVARLVGHTSNHHVYHIQEWRLADDGKR